jgi:hypothetical protein
MHGANPNDWNKDCECPKCDGLVMSADIPQRTNLELVRYYIAMSKRFLADYYERRDCPTYNANGELHGAEVCANSAQFFLDKHMAECNILKKGE